jgi:predicted O-methyltransferase YrrM
MANRSMGIPDDVLEYLLGVGVRESELLARLRAETAELPASSMQIAPEQGSFMALIARVLRLVRVGGLIMIDNVLWGGRVADPTESDSDTTAIRELNESLDGLTLARKR